MMREFSNLTRNYLETKLRINNMSGGLTYANVSIFPPKIVMEFILSYLISFRSTYISIIIQKINVKI